MGMSKRIPDQEEDEELRWLGAESCHKVEDDVEARGLHELDRDVEENACAASVIFVPSRARPLLVRSNSPAIASVQG